MRLEFKPVTHASSMWPFRGNLNEAKCDELGSG